MNRPEIIRTFEDDFARPVQLISEVEKRRAELEADINNFILGGGKMTYCEPAKYCQYDDDKKAAQRNEGERTPKKATMNSKFNPTSFANVYKSDADKTKFVVIIRQYISKQFKTATAAVNHRDWKLAGEKS